MESMYLTQYIIMPILEVYPQGPCKSMQTHPYIPVTTSSKNLGFLQPIEHSLW